VSAIATREQQEAQMQRLLAEVRVKEEESRQLHHRVKELEMLAGGAEQSLTEELMRLKELHVAELQLMEVKRREDLTTMQSEAEEARQRASQLQTLHREELRELRANLEAHLAAREES
jgi:hypothetical protein